MPTTQNNKTVLIAPLDWGLGHATRCVPIIRELQQQGCLVLIAASGAHAALLRQEFSNIEILPLQGYQIRYGKGNLIVQLLRQLPRFIKTIRQEHKWLKKLVTERKVAGIISDNRYGFYSANVPSVFITHQLRVQAPIWLKWLEPLAQKWIYRFTKNFDTCWIPDVTESEKSLAKKLSHPKQKSPVLTQYIGWLTRFSLQPPVIPKQYKLLVSLSGPEPQRTVLEKKIFDQLSTITEPVLMIRGLPNAIELLSHSLPNLTVVNHFSGRAMQKAIAESEIFLSRCGYSTLMDLQTVACQCIFIPTPGQTEQEYLGKEIAASGRAVVIKQANFDLVQTLRKAEKFPSFSDGQYHNKQLPSILAAWLATLS